MTDYEGFIAPLDETIYHTHPTSLSVSGAKVLLRSPALYRWQREHPEHKDTFDFGSAAHALVLGMDVASLVYIAPFDNWMTKQAKVEKTIAQTERLAPILHNDWLVICDMADALANHKTVADLLTDGQPEVSAFAVDQDTEVLRRCRYDYLRDDLAVDYKTANSAAPSEFSKACVRYGYAMQAAWYSDVATDLDHDLRGFVFIVQEKEPPYSVECYELDFDAMQWARDRNRAALERFRDCTASGIWPGYTGDPTIKPLSLPSWAWRDAS